MSKSRKMSSSTIAITILALTFPAMLLIGMIGAVAVIIFASCFPSSSSDND